MKIEELRRTVEEMIFDRNYMINTGTKDEKRMYAWEYSREELKIILQMIDNVIKSKE
jgi:hypothetical protein